MFRGLFFILIKIFLALGIGFQLFLAPKYKILLGMKKLNILLVALMSATALSLSSCTDECKDITCENGGTCNEGVCECADGYFGTSCETACVNGTVAAGACDCNAGYEGESCDIESRADMVGSYSVADACSASGTASYEVSMTTGSASADQLRVSGFWEIFVNSVLVTVNGDDLTIAEQEPDSDGWKVSGTGTYNENNTITWSYSITDPSGSVDACTATWAKL